MRIEVDDKRLRRQLDKTPGLIDSDFRKTATELLASVRGGAEERWPRRTGFSAESFELTQRRRGAGSDVSLGNRAGYASYITIPRTEGRLGGKLAWMEYVIGPAMTAEDKMVAELDDGAEEAAD